ncbi:MAG TPA: hypothetical protein VI685_12405 [Candidatus Angelobacter sp.]
MCPKFLTLILLLNMSALGQGSQNTDQHHAQHLHNWARLKAWVNEFPAWEKRKTFKDPELHGALRQLLGADNYKRLMEDFRRVVRTEVIGGYLVLRGFTDRSMERHETAFIVLGLNDGSTRVAFINEQKVIWRPLPAGDEPDLPDCILYQARTWGAW